MKKSNFFATSALMLGISFSCLVSYGSTEIFSTKDAWNPEANARLFQDTAARKAKPTKKAEIDRTKGEAGKGQGKGVDTIPSTTNTNRRAERSDMNRGTQDKTEQNSDNRGEGAGKNNRAGNSRKGVDSTKQ